MSQTTALLQTSRSRPYARLRVRFVGQTVEMELSVGGDVLWSGPWQGEVCRDGLPLQPASPWEAVCRYSDRDVDYLELALELAGDLRIERHVLLARKDCFLLLADAVLGDRAARLGYCGRLPLGSGVTLRQSKKSSSGSLFRGNRRVAAVLPLALPGQRGAAAENELAQDAEHLQLRQAAHARRLWAPLWFDLDRRRAARAATWRPLTVGEAMQAQPADVAVGCRVAAGRQQWLIYRSLAKPGNRTLLGHNLLSETLVARFHRNGRVQPLIEVE